MSAEHPSQDPYLALLKRCQEAGVVIVCYEYDDTVLYNVAHRERVTDQSTIVSDEDVHKIPQKTVQVLLEHSNKLDQ